MIPLLPTRERHPYYPPSAAPLRAADALVVRGAVCGGLSIGFAFALIIALAFVPGVPKAWLLAAVLLVTLLFVASWFRCRKEFRTVEALRTVHAQAGNDRVTVGYTGMVPLTLRRSEVTGLHEYQLLGLRIETADPARDLWVPFQTESYAAIKAQVGQWASLRTTPHVLLRVLDNVSLLAAMVFAVLMPLTFFSVALYLSRVVPEIFKQSAPLHRKLVAMATLAILLVRWLW